MELHKSFLKDIVWDNYVVFNEFLKDGVNKSENMKSSVEFKKTFRDMVHTKVDQSVCLSNFLSL
jgi:hypothetical protein